MAAAIGYGSRRRENRCGFRVGAGVRSRRWTVVGVGAVSSYVQVVSRLAAGSVLSVQGCLACLAYEWEIVSRTSMNVNQLVAVLLDYTTCYGVL